VAGNPKIVVDFVSDTSGLTSGFAKAEGSSSKFAASLKSVAKTGALAAGAAGVGALVYTLKTGIGEWQESQKVAAQTEAVLKSTGKAAGVTATQVADLATATMKKTGIDDEAIQSGENLLLTFTNVRNEVGKGNDIFTQATGIMTDMSVALGQDVKSSAIQLGKALNDPVKGMTALRRVGVSFTQAQTDQVKAMVEAGNTMGAQKLILRELTKEFGGSAEAIGKTLPGQLAILRESFNNFAGDLVGKAIPYIERFISSIQKNWPEIDAAITGTFNEIKPTLTELGATLAALGQVVAETAKIIRDNWATIGPIVKAQVAIFTSQLKLMADILRLLAALLRGDWSAAWRLFKQVVLDVVNVLRAQIEARLLPLKGLLGALWLAIRQAAQAAWTGIQTLVTAANNAIRSVITTVWNAIKSVVTTAAAGARTAVSTLTGAFNVAQSAVRALQGVLNALQGALNTARTAASNAAAVFRGPLEAAARAAHAALSSLSGVASSIAGAMSSAANAVRSLISAINSIPSHISLPHIPNPLSVVKKLGTGGIVTRPTFALIGERGPEAVIPLNQAGGGQGSTGGGFQFGGGGPVNVRVYIGDTELRGLVKAEIIQADTGLARTLLAGAATV
jgi:phage-related protein